MDMRTVFEYKCHLLSILQSKVRTLHMLWYGLITKSAQPKKLEWVLYKHFIWLETSNLSVHLMLQSHQRKQWLVIAA